LWRRARLQVTLCASTALPDHAVQNATARQSGLTARLREAA
jgi:hypothetical protein